MPKERPNILLITTDQQRFDTIACLGNNHIYTPHLDWLVEEGITYTRTYSDAPICMPARATIMTGKTGYNNGLTGNSSAVLPMKEFPTLPGILTEAGYQTRAQGKMHFHPMRANYGFEYMELPMEYYRERHERAHEGLPKQHGVGENEVTPVISTVDETHSLTHWTVKRSIDFLETRDDTRPFFMWTSFTKPHPPFDPCANYWALYQNMDMPDPVRGDWSENIEEIPQGFMASTYGLNNMYRLSPEQVKEVKKAYNACITQIDYSLGLLFARMREMDLLENTWIIFTADHGDMQGDHHMGAKTIFLEGSAHIPLIVRPPAGAWEEKPLANTRVESLTDLSDILPTVLNIAGVDIPDGVDGRDLLETMEKPDPDRVIIGHSSEREFAVIKGDYKYLWSSTGGGELLFNVKDDPYEQKELIRAGTADDIYNEYKGMLIEHMKKYKPEFVKDDKLNPGPGISGPDDKNKWPGFHSTVHPSDVLH